MKWDDCKITYGKGFRLSKISTKAGTKNSSKKESKIVLQNDVLEIAKWQNKLFAENRQSLLIILQGMDSAGKDGTNRNIMSGINPQGLMVTSFKHPSTEELQHDYL